MSIQFCRKRYTLCRNMLSHLLTRYPSVAQKHKTIIAMGIEDDFRNSNSNSDAKHFATEVNRAFYHHSERSQLMLSEKRGERKNQLVHFYYTFYTVLTHRLIFVNLKYSWTPMTPCVVTGDWHFRKTHCQAMQTLGILGNKLGYLGEIEATGRECWMPLHSTTQLMKSWLRSLQPSQRHTDRWNSFIDPSD